MNFPRGVGPKGGCKGGTRAAGELDLGISNEIPMGGGRDKGCGWKMGISNEISKGEG